jgi:hypothetical protein
MIRSRKDESSTTATVVATTKSSTVVGTPPPKQRSGGTTADDHDKSSLPAASPASISSSFAALSASSLQYYSQLAQGQRVRGTVKKKASKKKLANEAALWTQVQMPPRLLWSTLGIFLILPVLMFLWKETHIQSMDSAELRGQKYGGKASVLSSHRMRQKKQHREFVTWMANQVAPEEEELVEMANETVSSSDSEAETLNTTMDDGEALPHKEWNPKADEVLDVRAVGAPRGEKREPLTTAKLQEEEEVEEEGDDTLEE